MPKTRFASVILDEAIDRELDYSIPPDFPVNIAIGTRVLVPLRSQLRKGTIIDLRETSSIASIKPITEILSETPLIHGELLDLAHWMSEYYATPFRRVLRLFLPPTIRKGMEAKQQLFVTAERPRPQLVELCASLRGKKEAQAKLLDILLEHPKGILLTELLEKASVARTAFEQLKKQGVVSASFLAIERDPLANATFVPTRHKVLYDEQKTAFASISRSLSSGAFAVHLLHGITGSGKTEIYLQAIESVLKMGKTALFLVPEIALTSQTVERLKGRFSDQIALFHYRLSDGERRDAWHALQRGQARIAVGPRSTLFAPLKQLGLIIIDEEHDGSYKQTEEMPCYHARDVAVMRAKLASTAIILGSATPSLESYYNASQGKYHLSTLSVRAEKSKLPHVEIVDLREESPKQKGHSLFSRPLLKAIEERIKNGEQTLLFLNRRGYHAQRLCTACGVTLQCPHCDVALTFHRKDNRLTCHLCQYHLSPPPVQCSSCGSEDSLKYQGIGTEQVERVLHAIFPEVRTLRLDADTTKHKGSHDELFKQFRAGKAEVLIGTQMIAKGLHFPSVTLVGVLNADASLGIPDFRSGERVFQILTQVAGRAGRGALPGRVIIQTWLPEHPIIELASRQDYPAFYHQELDSRKVFNYPPTARLVKILASGPDECTVQKVLDSLRQELQKHLPSSYELQNVLPCGYPKIKDRFRFQFLIKGPSCGPITRLLTPLLQKRKTLPKELRILIDVDPLSTFS